jgi:hypothetical protein
MYVKGRLYPSMVIWYGSDVMSRLGAITDNDDLDQIEKRNFEIGWVYIKDGVVFVHNDEPHSRLR